MWCDRHHPRIDPLSGMLYVAKPLDAEERSRYRNSFSEIFFVFWSLSLPWFGELHRWYHLYTYEFWNCVISFLILNISLSWACLLLAFYSLCLLSIVVRIESGFNGIPGFASGSWLAVDKFHLLSAGCSLLGDEGFVETFSLKFLVIKTLDPYPKSHEMLDQDPDTDPDPQYYLSVGNTSDSPPSPTSIVHPQLFCYIFPALCLCNPCLDPLGIHILRMGTVQSLLFAFQCKVNTWGNVPVL